MVISSSYTIQIEAYCFSRTMPDGPIEKESLKYSDCATTFRTRYPFKDGTIKSLSAKNNLIPC